MNINLKQARILLDGFRQGAFDEYDLAAIFQWGTDWLEEFGTAADPHDEVVAEYSEASLS